MMKRGRGRPKGSKNMTTQVAGKQAAVLVKFPDGELLDAIVEGARTHERTLQGQIRYLLKKALGRVGADE